ncbi:MAG: hypothetical protein ABJP48_10095 [Erythrobacter sp.]
MIKAVLRPIRFGWHFFWDVTRFLCFEGRWSHSRMHGDVIEAVLNYVDPEVASLVRRQLRHTYFLDTAPRGLINVFWFYEKDRLPHIEDQSYFDRLFKVEIFVGNRRHISMVTFFEGRIFSVEFKKPRGFFKGEKYRIGKVTDGKPSDTYTRVIDRAEHGKETEGNP